MRFFKNWALIGLSIFVIQTTNAVEQTHSPSNIELYALNTDAVKNTNGMGVKFNSEDLKLKLELSKNFIKTGMVAKFNPQDSKFYFKTGLNLSNQKLFVGDNSSARVNQVSAALATGYLLKDDLYAEVGLSNTKLNGKNK